MLAVGVRVPIAMNAVADDLAVALDPVARIGDDDVPTVAARDPVDAPVVLHGDPVVAALRDDPVGAVRAGEEVGSLGADHGCLHGASRDGRQRRRQNSDGEPEQHAATVANAAH